MVRRQEQSLTWCVGVKQRGGQAQHWAACACSRLRWAAPFVCLAAACGTMSRVSAFLAWHRFRPACCREEFHQILAEVSRALSFCGPPGSSSCDVCPSHCVRPAAGGAFKCTDSSVCQQAGVLGWRPGFFRLLHLRHPACLHCCSCASCVQDIPGALSDAQVAEGLGLTDIKNRDWSIFKTSAIKGTGVLLCWHRMLV